MVRRTERHLGFDNYVVLHIIAFGMERSPHPAEIADQDGLVLFLPLFVIVFVDHLCDLIATIQCAIELKQFIDALFQITLVILIGGDIRLQSVEGLVKTVVRSFVTQTINQHVAEWVEFG